MRFWETRISTKRQENPREGKAAEVAGVAGAAEAGGGWEEEIEARASVFPSV
jgi:hypothetical protein